MLFYSQINFQRNWFTNASSILQDRKLWTPSAIIFANNNRIDYWTRRKRNMEHNKNVLFLHPFLIGAVNCCFSRNGLSLKQRLATIELPVLSLRI